VKQAIVTGATGGIGHAIAIALRDAGYRVLALGRDGEALAALAAMEGMETRAVDLVDRAALRAAVGGVQADVLVNNAGMMPPLAAFPDLEEDQIDRAIAINLTAALALTRMVVPGMRDRGAGHVFFTGSTAGHAPFANLALYCATKAAIAGFAQALRLDLAPHGVRVTEIVAGRVETGLYRDVLPADQRAAMYAGGGAVQPQDVAAIVTAVLALPGHVDVARFDILPTHQATATGAPPKGTRA
jgi:3-hydroxy acid dehydrogenase/malonic semialdehyde reductase